MGGISPVHFFIYEAPLLDKTIIIPFSFVFIHPNGPLINPPTSIVLYSQSLFGVDILVGIWYFFQMCH